MKVDYSHLETAIPKDGWVILGPGGGGCVHTLTVSPHRILLPLILQESAHAKH